MKLTDAEIDMVVEQNMRLRRILSWAERRLKPEDGAELIRLSNAAFDDGPHIGHWAKWWLAETDLQKSDET